MEGTGTHPTRDQGLQLIKSGDYRAAVSVLDHIVETDPLDAQAFLYLGVAYAEMGNRAEAIASFEQSVSVKSSARGHYNLGLAYESVERLGEALTQFQYAARMDPNYKPAQDSIERMKQQGVQATESTTQWTIGAQSVAEVAAQKAREAEEARAQMEQAGLGQTTALPQGFTPSPQPHQGSGPGGQPAGPRPLLPGQLEAMQEAKIREHQKQLTIAGLKYGALIGPFAMMATLLTRMYFSPGSGPGLLFIVLGGIIGGSVVGAVCGYTGGDEDTGKWVGALGYASITLLAGVTQGLDLSIVIPVIINTIVGFFAGRYIGKLVSASIGWD